MRHSPKPYLLLLTGCVLAGMLYLFWPISKHVLHDEGITSTRIFAGGGELLREVRQNGRGVPVSLDEINPDVVDAVIAVEDRHFYNHFGINPISILRALKSNAEAGAIVGGGSTLTMQVARTLRGNQKRTVFQKMAEALLALRLEAQLDKSEILLLWLNRVYFGNQAYGIEAAAQLYFQKPALDLTLPEASFLAGLPQRPNAYNPYQHLDLARQRQQRVLDAMVVAEYITPEEAHITQHIPLSLTSPDLSFKAPHFVQYVQHEAGDVFETATAITTTLDLPLQQSIEALTRAHLERLGNDRASNAAVIVIDNETGDVLTYVGSADFWNTAIEGQNDGVTMLRQPGSALKPFTYALALSSGKYTPASILPDIEIHIPEAGGAFSPLNYDKKFHGPVPLRTSLASSFNVPAVRLLRELGPEPLINVLHDAGITSLTKSPDHYGVGLTLGNGEVQLLELARAYASLARQGQSLAPRSIVSVSLKDGSSYAPPDLATHPTGISPEVAFLITDILQDPEAREPGFGRHGPLELPFPVAVKTGTSKDYRDNWAVGYTPSHTVAVWVGNFNGQPMRRVSGVSGAGPLFHAVIQLLGPGGTFEQPASIASGLICPISGQLPGASCPGVKKEFFLAGTVPTDTCTIHQHLDIDTRTGLLAETDTPPAFVKTELFTIYPEMYKAWARKNGILMPPASSTSVQWVTEYESGAVSPQLQVAYPKSAMTFQLDPVLQPAFQKIKLEGIVPGDLRDVNWWVNDQKLAGSPQGAFWPLEAGIHTIELRAQTPGGKSIRSLPVTITVLAPAALSSD